MIAQSARQKKVQRPIERREHGDQGAVEPTGVLIGAGELESGAELDRVGINAAGSEFVRNSWKAGQRVGQGRAPVEIAFGVGGIHLGERRGARF